MTAMTFGVLQSEVFGRGVNYLNDGGAGVSRVKRWINVAYQELCDAEDWPFLQALATGSAPLTIANLGVVESVTRDNGVKLYPADRRQLTEDYNGLADTGGTAVSYYVAPGPSIVVYPAETITISVRYWKVAGDLVVDADTPVVPARFHELIVLGALRRAFLEESDAGDYGAVDAEWQRGVQSMRERVLLWHRDGNTQQLSISGHGDS